VDFALKVPWRGIPVFITRLVQLAREKVKLVIDRSCEDIFWSEINNPDPGQQLFLKFDVSEFAADEFDGRYFSAGLDYDMKNILAADFRILA
jgi:hypothetical protein